MGMGSGVCEGGVWGNGLRDRTPMALLCFDDLVSSD